MLKKVIATSLSLALMATYIPVYAQNNDNSCRVQIAVATPPIPLDHNVAFNVTAISNNGPSESLTLKGGSAPQYIENLTCGLGYTISATDYSTPSNLSNLSSEIGQCSLKANPVLLAGPGNSVSVVFPNDFICN